MWGQKIDPLAFLEAFHQPCLHSNACDSGFGNSKKVCFLCLCLLICAQNTSQAVRLDQVGHGQAKSRLTDFKNMKRRIFFDVLISSDFMLTSSYSLTSQYVWSQIIKPWLYCLPEWWALLVLGSLEGT